ncbi:MAG: hypothetical protein U9Q70_04715, partial [Chloroflexota bacterium]|nr:hypothetical protein [Chloroflexota bacterium]
EQSQAAWREQMQARTVTYHYAGREVVAEDVPPVMDMPASHNLEMEVFSRGLRLGTLLLQRAAESSPWTAEERLTVQSLVKQLGPALETARLFEDAQRRAANEKVMGDITAEMFTSLDMNAILEKAVAEIGEALDLHDLTIQLTGA